MRSKKQINVEIGERIKRAREEKNLTQEKLAETIDVSTQYVSDLERGVVGASLSTLKSICTALDVTSDQLLFGNASEEVTQIHLMESCASLTPKQLKALTEIIKIYIQAIKE